MNCPFCGHEESRVIDSRESPDGIRRRRECARCELRFTTYERVHTMPLLVAKAKSRIIPQAPTATDLVTESCRC